MNLLSGKSLSLSLFLLSLLPLSPPHSLLRNPKIARMSIRKKGRSNGPDAATSTAKVVVPSPPPLEHEPRRPAAYPPPTIDSNDAGYSSSSAAPSPPEDPTLLPAVDKGKGRANAINGESLAFLTTTGKIKTC